MNHNAIYALYPQVVTIDDTAGAFDKNDNQVEIDLDLVNAWVDPEQYKYQRKAEYPSIQDQLDMQYWDKINGTNHWETLISQVKTKYPKGQ
jgi:hypothetical protein